MTTINNEVVRSESRAANRKPRKGRMVSLQPLLQDWAEELARGQRTIHEYLAAARHHVHAKEALEADLPEDEFLNEDPRSSKTVLSAQM